MAKNRKQKDQDDEKKFLQDKIEETYSKLFSEPGGPPAHIGSSELKAMRMRIAELEAKLAGQEIPGFKSQATNATWRNNVEDSLPVSGSIDSTPEPTPDQEQEKVGFLRSLLRAPTFDDPSKNRIARLQHQVLLGLIFTGVLALIILIATWSPTSTITSLIILVVNLIVLIGTFLLQRQGRLQLVSWILVSLLYLVTVSTMITGSFSVTTVLLLVVFVTLAGLLLKPIQVVAIMVVGIITIYIGPIIDPATIIPQTSLTFLAVILGLDGLLLTIASGTLDQSFKEVDRSTKALVGTNKQLQDLSSNLEQRVASRTHDLELAAEVGRVLNEKTTDLYGLLTKSVNLIGERFDLYYTQVYLKDNTGNNLVLRAGTGEAGAKLLERGHHLVIAPSSLNGRAASEKRAVIVTDTRTNPNFMPNPLLPETRSEMAVPLIADGQVIGVLDMQSTRPGVLSEGNLPAFEVLAGQVAIAIQNTTLFAETEYARSQMEAQVRTITEQGWSSFLNAIERGQRIGFMYDQQDITPMNMEDFSVLPAGALSLPIIATGTEIGMIQLETDPSRTWTVHDAELLEATAEQLGRHIDSLRLLAQAEHYQSQAEEITRRLTGEAWSSQQVRKAVAPAYIYNLNEVTPFYGENNASLNGHARQSLMIRNEAIGELTAETEEHSEEAKEIVAAVAAQLSSHIENLRLLEETQEQRGQLADALSVAKLGNWEYDFKNDLFTFNDNLYQIFHTTVQEVGGYRLSSAEYAKRFVHPEDADMVGAEIGKSLASKSRVYDAQLEHRILYTDGGVGYLAVTVHLEKDENGQILRWTGANQDITERKNAELAVRESEQRLQKILTALPTSILISRLSDGILMYNNIAFTNLFGYEEQEMVGKRTPDFYYEPEDRKEVFKELDAKGSLDGYELRIKHSDGHLIWVLLNVFPIRYGEDDCLLIGAVDVTKRKQIEDSLTKRASQLETVAILSATTSTVLDPDTLLQEVVDLTKERFELYHAHVYLVDDSQEALRLASGAGEVGQKMTAQGFSIPMNTERSLVARAFRERNALRVNDTRNEPDFLPNVLLPETRAEMAVPMIVGDRVLGVFDVQSDVVDGFTVEDANIYTALASQVAVALQNARLYVEQADTVTQLRELDKLKSSFLANMSHELRTPLNSILGFTDVMLEELDGPLTPNMDNDLKLIQKNGKHLLHLINDVLDMAKIESGKMNLIIEKFNLNETINDVMSITSSLANEKSIAFFIDPESDQDVFIRADHTRLRQVLINLFNNGIKFTEKGSVSICVRHQGNDVLVTVKDTGLGIPADHLDTVFKEFIQVDSTTTRKSGGTGLGLPISRRLIEMHGGKLWAESSGVSGEGSTFHILLPIEAVVAEAAQSESFEKK